MAGQMLGRVLPQPTCDCVESHRTNLSGSLPDLDVVFEAKWSSVDELPFDRDQNCLVSLSTADQVMAFFFENSASKSPATGVDDPRVVRLDLRQRRYHASGSLADDWKHCGGLGHHPSARGRARSRVRRCVPSMVTMKKAQHGSGSQ